MAFTRGLASDCAGARTRRVRANTLQLRGSRNILRSRRRDSKSRHTRRPEVQLADVVVWVVVASPAAGGRELITRRGVRLRRASRNEYHSMGRLVDAENRGGGARANAPSQLCRKARAETPRRVTRRGPRLRGHPRLLADAQPARRGWPGQ